MAFVPPTHVGSGSTTGNSGGTATADLSSIAWQDGDIVVFFWGSNGSTSLSAPAGLTQVGSERIYWRELQTGDSDTWDWPITGTVFWGLGWAVFRNWDGNAPEHLYTGTDNNQLNMDSQSTTRNAPYFIATAKSSRGVSQTPSGGTDFIELWLDVVGVNFPNDNNGGWAGAAVTSGTLVFVGTLFSSFQIVALGGVEVADPDPDSGWWIEVWDLDNQNKLMDDWVPAVNCVFERVFNDIGSGSLTVPASWSRIGELCDPPNDVTTLLKVYIDATFRYAFRADQVEKTYQEDGNAVVRIFGPGFENVVNDRQIPAFDYPDNPSLYGDWVYGKNTVYDYGFDNETYIATTAGTAASTASWTEYSVSFTATSDTTRVAVQGTDESEFFYLAAAKVTDNTGGFDVYTSDFDAGSEDGWEFGDATGTAGGTAGFGAPSGYGTAYLEVESNASDVFHTARRDGIETTDGREYTFSVQIAGAGTYRLVVRDLEALDGWTVGRANAVIVNGPVNDDEAMKVTTSSVDDFHQVRQTFSTTPGATYEFTALVAGTGTYYLKARDMSGEGADFLSDETLIGEGGTVTPGGTSAYATANWSFEAPGSYTRFAIQTENEDDTFYVGSITINEGRDAESAGAIAIDLLNASSTASDIEVDITWSDATDSSGDAWSPATIAFSQSDGVPYGSFLDRLVGLGYEWEVVPPSYSSGGDTGYALYITNPDGLGNGLDDYASTEVVPAITEGQVIFGGQSRQQIPINTVRVVTEGGYWAEAEYAAGTAAYGRRMEIITNSQVSGTAIAAALAAERLVAHRDQSRALWVELSEDSDVRPFLDFNTGDIVDVSMGQSFGVNEYMRVRAIRADLTGEGNEIKYSVELRPD